MKLKIIKKISAFVTIIMTVYAFSINAFSIIDFSVGESGLINNDSTPYKVSIISGDKIAAVVPIGVGLRGDADGNGEVDLPDAVLIARYMLGTYGNDFVGSKGYTMADTNQDNLVELDDAVNIAKYILASGSHEEKWIAILGKDFFSNTDS